MGLKKEVKQAALDWLGSAGASAASVLAVQRGERHAHGYSDLVAAMLDVFNGYKEMKVEEFWCADVHVLRLPDTRMFGQEPHRVVARTIYTKMQEPEPTDKELMQRMVDAWHASGEAGQPVADAVHALADRLDKS